MSNTGHTPTTTPAPNGEFIAACSCGECISDYDARILTTPFRDEALEYAQYLIDAAEHGPDAPRFDSGLSLGEAHRSAWDQHVELRS